MAKNPLPYPVWVGDTLYQPGEKFPSYTTHYTVDFWTDTTPEERANGAPNRIHLFDVIQSGLTAEQAMEQLDEVREEEIVHYGEQR